MRIGLGKLHTSKRALQGAHDTNGRYLEITALHQAFEAAGHDTDLVDVESAAHYDTLFILNNEILEPWRAFSELAWYRQITKRLVYIVTDLRLVHPVIGSQVDAFATQSPVKCLDTTVPQFYSGMPELAVYIAENELFYSIDHSNRSNLFIFGGGDRDRKEDFDTYILQDWRNAQLYLKLLDKGVDTRVSIDKFHRALHNSKYTLIINDKSYNETGFNTWRYFESVSRDVITFLDHKVDKYQHLPLDPETRAWLTVKDRHELVEKMMLLELNREQKFKIQAAQTRGLSEAMTTGTFTIEALLGGGYSE